MIEVERYNQIKRVSKPIFIVTVIIFFIVEFSYLLEFEIFLRRIPDVVFLLIVFFYFCVEFLPIFKPDWIIGYEPPEIVIEEEEEKVLSPEEQELKELEDIAL